MAFDYLIDTKHRTVFSYAWDVLVIADVMNHREFISKDPRFRPDFRQIAHFLDLKAVNLTGSEISRLAGPHMFDPAARRAFVLTVGFQQGLGRMFQAYGDLNEGVKNLLVCPDLASATAWIGIPLEVAEQAFQQLRKNNPPA